MERNIPRRAFLKTSGVAASAGALALAGCLGGDDGDNPTAELNTQNLGNKEAEEDVEISVWLSVSAEDILQPMADEFSNQSDTIEVTVSEEGSYGEVLNQTQQAQEADEPPEIVHLNAVATLPMWVEDRVTPVSDIFGDELDTGDFVDAVGNYYVIDDTLLGLPFAVSTVTASYNMTAFEEAGLPADPAEVPLETYGDWIDSSETLVDETNFSQAVTWPKIGWFYESFMSMQGQNFLNNNNGRDAPATESLVDEDPVREIYEWNKELYENDYYLAADGWNDARQAFANQEAAVQLDSSASLRDKVDGAAEAGFEMDVGMVPHHDDRDGEGLIIGGGSLFVPSEISGAQLEAAAEFLLYLAEPEQQAQFHMQTGYYPTSQEAEQIAEDEGFYDDYPQFQRAFQQLKDRPETPATAGAFTYDHGELREQLDNGIDRLLGGDSVDSVLDSMKEDLDEVLERASAADPR